MDQPYLQTRTIYEMKLAILFLLLTTTAFCQTPKFTTGPGAGQNPIIVFSGGQDLMTVHITIGDGATMGNTIEIDISEGGPVETVTYSQWCDGVPCGEGVFATENKILMYPREKPNVKGCSIETLYVIKRKPIKRAMKPILLAILLTLTSCHTTKPITSDEMSEIFGGAKVMRDGRKYYIMQGPYPYFVEKTQKNGYLVWYVSDGGTVYENNKQALVFQGKLNLSRK